MLPLGLRCAALVVVLGLLATTAGVAQMRSNLPQRDRLALHASRAAPQSDRPALIRAASVRRLPPDVEPMDPAPQPQREFGLALADLEQMAAQNNPALAAAQGRLNAAQGHWVQVGLKPNPVVGYIGDDIGADGGAGAQGAFIRQEFVRGCKLQLNREVAAAAVARAVAEFEASQMRVLTDVRTQFYRTLLAQRRLDLTNELADVAEQAAATAKRLLDLREGRRVDYLRARIDADRMKLAAREANAQHVAAWRELSIVVGLPNLSRQALRGDLDDDLPALEFDVLAQQVITGSPLVVAAQADVDRLAWAISRAEAEPIPNLAAGVELKHDTISDNMLVVVEAGFQLPIWNKNQGGIQRAYGDHAAAVARLEQLTLQLRREMVVEFQKYDAARARTLQFARNILPDSRETIELVEAGLAGGELSYLDLLTARRALHEANLDYLDALEALWNSSQRIDGLLLSGSLESR